MNRNFKNLFFLVVCVLIVSCRQTVSVVKFPISESEYLNYDKVKITYADNESSQTIKGFIRFKIDSAVCFQFWGPLGYELLKGSFTSKKLDIFSRYDVSITKKAIENTLGIVFDYLSFQDLLLGRDSLLISALNDKNALVLSIEHTFVNKNKTQLIIQHKTSKKQVIIRYLRDGNYVKSIHLSIQPDNIELNISILEISNKDKISYFRFKENR